MYFPTSMFPSSQAGGGKFGAGSGGMYQPMNFMNPIGFMRPRPDVAPMLQGMVPATGNPAPGGGAGSGGAPSMQALLPALSMFLNQHSGGNAGGMGMPYGNDFRPQALPRPLPYAPGGNDGRPQPLVGRPIPYAPGGNDGRPQQIRRPMPGRRGAGGSGPMRFFSF